MPRALTLADALARKVTAGVPILKIEQLPDPSVAEAPGSLFLLLDSLGAALGSGFADPENGVVRILSTSLEEEVSSLDAAFFRRRVERARALRQRVGLCEPGHAWRLLNGEGDALGGFTADIYGEFGVVYSYAKGLLGHAQTLAASIIEVCGLRGVVVKLRPRGGPKPGRGKQLIVGEEPPEKWIVQEMGVPFETHLLGGLNVGLFSDMRDHRRGFGRWTRDARVLNTFAYTGAFSVKSALEGARAVTSVDLSSGVLKWARANFELSGFDPDDPRWRFETSDVMRYLERAAAAGERFDTVILDPPTYSAARANSWSMKNDYAELVRRSAEVIDPSGGFLWAAANAHRGVALEPVLMEGLRQARRSGLVLETGGLPPDFPTPASWPSARYLQVVVVAVR